MTKLVTQCQHAAKFEAVRSVHHEQINLLPNRCRVLVHVAAMQRFMKAVVTATHTSRTTHENNEHCENHQCDSQHRRPRLPVIARKIPHTGEIGRTTITAVVYLSSHTAQIPGLQGVFGSENLGNLGRNYYQQSKLLDRINRINRIL